MINGKHCYLTAHFITDGGISSIPGLESCLRFEIIALYPKLLVGNNIIELVMGSFKNVV